MDDAFDLEIELRMVQEDLRELPAEAFNDRITLRDRIIELEAAIANATPVPVDSLQSELAELEAKRLVMVKTRMNPSNANGGLGLAGGIDPNFLHKANRRIDEMTGIREVEERIREIERLLDGAPSGSPPPTAKRPPS
jgi:hypothetical protein